MLKGDKKKTVSFSDAQWKREEESKAMLLASNSDTPVAVSKGPSLLSLMLRSVDGQNSGEPKDHLKDEESTTKITVPDSDSSEVFIGSPPASFAAGHNFNKSYLLQQEILKLGEEAKKVEYDQTTSSIEEIEGRIPSPVSDNGFSSDEDEIFEMEDVAPKRVVGSPTVGGGKFNGRF
ncbi:MAG: hypothetical protein KGQ36_00740 [Rickettsiales bacterium]|nr:hypothetical protein [Rickettsiales bacterium]